MRWQEIEGRLSEMGNGIREEVRKGKRHRSNRVEKDQNILYACTNNTKMNLTNLYY